MRRRRREKVNLAMVLLVLVVEWRWFQATIRRKMVVVLFPVFSLFFLFVFFLLCFFVFCLCSPYSLVSFFLSPVFPFFSVSPSLSVFSFVSIFFFYLVSISLFFFSLVSSLIFSSPTPSPGEGVFIKGRERKSYLTPIQSWRRGRVAGVGSVQPPQSHPQGLSPLPLSSWW